ncbi:MAG: peptidylprolyl isomerase [Flavobacteriaceae bacterium]
MMNNLFRIFIVFIFSLCVIISCKEETSKPKNRVTIQKPIEKSRVIKKKKKTNIITNKNAVVFFTEYGKKNLETVVLFETRLGNIKIKLYEDTPMHRASFIFLIKSGYFSTTCFHRIVPGFIIQGGNSDSPITRKYRIDYNYTLASEMKPHRRHKYGALAAAREWENNPKKRSTPYEFYMIQDKRGSHHLEGEHTVFGEIIEGFSTMEKISKLKTDVKEWPIKEVFIKASVIR